MTAALKKIWEASGNPVILICERVSSNLQLVASRLFSSLTGRHHLSSNCIMRSLISARRYTTKP